MTVPKTEPKPVPAESRPTEKTYRFEVEVYQNLFPKTFAPPYEEPPVPLPPEADEIALLNAISCAVGQFYPDHSTSANFASSALLPVGRQRITELLEGLKACSMSMSAQIKLSEIRELWASLSVGESRWISVEEKLPERDTPVLCGNPAWTRPLIGQVDQDGYWEGFDCGIESQSIGGVTHWQPLPKPPELGLGESPLPAAISTPLAERDCVICGQELKNCRCPSLPAEIESRTDLRDFLTRLDGLFCDVSQLLDGWHCDGTAWSKWDEEVREQVRLFHREILNRKAADSTRTQEPE